MLRRQTTSYRGSRPMKMSSSMLSLFHIRAGMPLACLNSCKQQWHQAVSIATTSTRICSWSLIFCSVTRPIGYSRYPNLRTHLIRRQHLLSMWYCPRRAVGTHSKSTILHSNCCHGRQSQYQGLDSLWQVQVRSSWIFPEAPPLRATLVNNRSMTPQALWV